MVDTRGPRLRGRLTLDTKPFRKSLKGARKRSRGAFRGMEASSQRLAGAFKALGGVIAGVFAARAIKSFFDAGSALEQTKISLEGLLGSAQAADQAFSGIEDLSVRVTQDVNDLSKAFLVLETAQLGSTKNLELAADVATVFGRTTEEVANALRSLETETLRNAFGFDQVSTAAGKFSASLNGVVVAQAETRAGFRQSILDFVETSRFAGSATNAADAFGSGLSTLTNSIATVSARLREILGPSLVAIAGEVRAVAQEFTGLIDANESALGERAALAVQKFLNLMVGFRKVVTLQIQFVRDAIQELSDRLHNSLAGRLILTSLKTATFGVRQLAKAFGFAAQEGLGFTEQLGKNTRAARDNAQGSQEAAVATDAHAKGIRNVNNALSETGKGFNTFSSSAKDAKNSGDALKTTVDANTASFAALAKTAGSASSAISQVSQSQASAASASTGGGGSVSAGRSRTNLGQVADTSDPASIRRALAGLREQHRQVSFGAGAASRIQQRAVSAEISRLEQALREANRQQTEAVVDAIINANRDLSGEALTQRINQELEIRKRQGLLPSSGSTDASYVSMTGARF